MSRFPARPLALLCAASALAASVSAPAASAAGAPPPAPFVESVAPQGLGVLVSWAPESPTAAVTSYSVQALAAPGTTLPPGCKSVTVTVPGEDSAALVGGLCKEAAYAARVSATNSAGQGAWSATSNPFAPLPAEVPSAPLVTSVLGREKSLDVSWAPPTSNGGAALSGYVVKATAGGSTTSVSVGASTTSATVSGLTDGTEYTVTVIAQNSVGESLGGTGAGTPRTVYAPGAPQQLTAVPSTTGSVSLSWQPPIDNGGATISSYQVTYEQMTRSSSGSWEPAAGAKPKTVSLGEGASGATINGLSPADAYWSFSVAAVNSAGTGTAASVGQPVAGETSANPNDVVLSEATMAALASDTNGELTWLAPAPSQVASLKAGQVVVAAPSAAAPQGLLDSVLSITKKNTGAYVVGIAQASLSQAFTNLSVAGTVNPLAAGQGAQQATFRPALAGVRMLARQAAGIGFSEDITLGLDFGEGAVKMSGELDITPSVAIDIALSHDFVGVPNGAVVKASAAVGVKASLAATLQGSFSKKLGELNGAPEDYQVGPVPVIVVPKIPIYLTASGEIKTEISASIKLGAEATWSSSKPASLAVKNLSTPLTVSGNPLADLSGSVSIGFHEQPQLDLYDAAGPNFEANEKLSANVDPTPKPGQDYFSIEPSLELGAGWDIDLLGYHASLEAKIADLSFTPFAIVAAPGAALMVSPASASVPVGGSLQLTASRSDGKSYPVTWSIVGGAGDTISSTGKLLAAAPAGRTLTVLATDSTGASGESTIAVGQPFDPPENLTVTSAHTGKSATVSWSAPASTGGSPLTKYTIVTEPLTASRSVLAPSTEGEISGLTPGVTYLVSVYATNEKGLRSPAATVQFTPTVTCSISWTGASGGSWSTPSDWSLDRVPDSDDLVCIEGADVKLSSAVTVYGLTLDGGALSTTSALTATGLLDLQSGTIEGTGAPTVQLSAGGTLAATAATVQGAHLLNDGEATFSGATLGAGAVLENAATLTLADGTTIGTTGSPEGRLVNDAGATLQYPGGPSAVAIDAPIANSGTIDASAGTLTLDGSVTQTGSGLLAGAGTIELRSSFTPSGTGVKLSDATLYGSILGPGTVAVPSGGTLTLADGSRLSGVEVIDKGTLQIATGPTSVYLEEGATLTDESRLILPEGAAIDSSGSLTGKLVDEAGSTLEYTGGEPASIQVPLHNRGTVQADGGTLALTGSVTQTSSGSFAGPGTIELRSSFTPSGTGVHLSDATLYGSLDGPGTVTVPVGGAFVLDNGARVREATLVNMGSLTVGPGLASTYIESAGAIENDGTLTLEDGATIDEGGGRILNGAGATIDYPGGSDGASIQVPLRNSGTIQAGAGTLALTGNVTQTSTGSFTGPGTIKLQSSFIPSGSGVRIADATITGSITGPGTVTVPAGGALTLANGARVREADLVNKGSLTEEPGTTYIEGASTIENAGTLTIDDNGTMELLGRVSGRLINGVGATLDYPGGNNGASIDVPFDNHGTVDLEVGGRGGTLYVYGGNYGHATDNGTYEASAGATIDFEQGVRVLASGFRSQGPGTFEVSGGEMVVAQPTSIPDLALDGGGRIDGPGVLTVPSGGRLRLASGGFLGDAVRLVNEGSAVVQKGAQLSIEGGSTLENTGALQIADGATLSYPYAAGRLVNESGATIEYPGGTSGATISLPFDNHGTVSAPVGARGGTLYLEDGNSPEESDTGTYSSSSDGTIDFAGGQRTLASTATLSGPGSIEAGGAYVIDSAVAAGAVLRLQSGTLELTPQASGELSDFVENSPASLLIDISASTPTAEPARLGVSGEAALGGTLELQPEAGLVPAPGTTLYLLDYAKKTGAFSTIDYPLGELEYALSVGAKALSLQAGALGG